jgi:hypothetical protein
MSPSSFQPIHSKLGQRPLLEWIVNYFSPPNRTNTSINDALRGATPVMCTQKMPLVLQVSEFCRLAWQETHEE